MKEGHNTWLYKYTTLSLYPRKGLDLSRCVRNRVRQTDRLAILTHNFFLAALWDVTPAGCSATRWRSPWLTESLLTASWDWLYLNWVYAYIISEHPLFLLNHVTDSANFHRCVLCREISDWRLGQGSVWNILILTCFPRYPWERLYGVVADGLNWDIIAIEFEL